MGSSRILLVDDDVELCQLLQEYLEGHGLDVSMIHQGEPILDMADLEASYDLICLDIMMPGISGLTLLPAIRAKSNIPVIMVTGRGDDIDRVVGLEMGADDYIAKPCNPRELLARINAVLRRIERPSPVQQNTSPSNNKSPTTSEPSLEVQGLVLFPGRREALLNNEPLQLTGAEFDILVLLMQQQGQVISKAELTEKVLHRELTRYDRSMDVHVSRVRQKLSTLQPDVEWIKTVRGSGYIFVATKA